MRKAIACFAAIVAVITSGYGQQKNVPSSKDFKTNFVNPSELVVEGTITDISYFRDTDSAVFNTLYPCFTFDQKGIWFIKYTVQVHKIFKGMSTPETITVIDLNHSNLIEDKGISVQLSRSCRDGYDRSDYAVSRTGIFMLKQNFNTKRVSGDTYYLHNDVIGDYNKILTKYLPSITENGKTTTFQNTEQLYLYMEKQTGTRKVDLTHKKFRIITKANLDQYLLDNFHDSAYSKDIQDKISKEEINQLNIAQYQVAAKAVEKVQMEKEKQRKDSAYKAEQREGMKFIEQQKKEAIQRKKKQSLNKAGETVTYSFVNATYTKDAGGVYLEFDVNFNANVGRYLYQTNVQIKYNTAVFGANVISSSALTVTRGALVSNAAQYPNFSKIQMATDEVLLTAFGAYTSSPPVSNNNAFFNAFTDYTVFHVKLKVLSGGFGLNTNLRFNETDMDGFFPGSFTNTATSSSATNFDVISAPGTDNHKAGYPEINSFNSMSIAGGVGNTFEINGRFFGPSQGISGDVEMQSSESKTVGSNSITRGTFVFLDRGFDIIGWTDRKITIKLPSKVDTYLFPVTIGTGMVKVTNDIHSTPVISTLVLDVPYSLFEEFSHSGPTLTQKARYALGRENGSNGYDIKIHQTVASNTSAMKCIISALKKWSCETHMNWRITDVVNYLPTGIHANEVIIYFDNLGTGGTLMGTAALSKAGCGTTNTKLFYIAINNAVTWNYDMTSTSTITSGGSDFYQAILHELGHGMGLAHTNVHSPSSVYDLMYYSVSHPGRTISIGGNDRDAGITAVNYSSIGHPSCPMNLLYPVHCNTNLSAITVRELYLSHNCASSTLKPEIRTLFMNTPVVSPPEYTYLWEAQMPDQDGAFNATTLNYYGVAKPLVNSYTLTGNKAIASYKLTVYDDSDIPNYTTAKFTTYLRSGLADDYSMRDSYWDRLNEPNDQAARNSALYWDIWQSPDIWNRVNPDGDLSHKDPEYQGPAVNNYLYTRIRNVGCSAPASTRNLRLYWTLYATGEKWDEDWTTTNITTSLGTFPGGREITSGTGINITPPLQPGDERIIMQPWIPPRPQNYDATFTKISACVLARIEETPAYPFGMTFPEFFQTPPKTPISVRALKDNVTNNNNIVTRNLYVNNLSGYKKKSDGNPVLIGGNPIGGPISIGIGVVPYCPDLPNYFDIGTATVVLPPAMFFDWLAAGAQGYGISIDFETYSIRMMEPDARIDMLNTTNEAGEDRSFIQVFFELNEPVVYNGVICYYMFSMRQYNAAGETDEYGAGSFEVNVDLQPIPDAITTDAPVVDAKVRDEHNVRLLLFPSPATDNLNIVYTEQAGNNAIRIYDELGRLVKEASFNSTTKQDIMRTVDVSALHSGYYFLTIQSSNGVMKKKFLKE